MSYVPSADDYVAIQTMLARYVWALDTADIAEVGAIFTEDGLFEDTAGNVAEGREAVVAYFGALMDRDDFRGRQHHIDGLLVTPSDEGFACKSYWTVTKWHSERNAKVFEVVGWSTDTFRRTGGGLLFSERRVHYWRDTDCPWAKAG